MELRPASCGLVWPQSRSWRQESPWRPLSFEEGGQGGLWWWWYPRARNPTQPVQWPPPQASFTPPVYSIGPPVPPPPASAFPPAGDCAVKCLCPVLHLPSNPRKGRQAPEQQERQALRDPPPHDPGTVPSHCSIWQLRSFPRPLGSLFGFTLPTSSIPARSAPSFFLVYPPPTPPPASICIPRPRSLKPLTFLGTLPLCGTSQVVVLRRSFPPRHPRPDSTRPTRRSFEIPSSSSGPRAPLRDSSPPPSLRFLRSFSSC
jgi:hypothetical protein